MGRDRRMSVGPAMCRLLRKLSAAPPCVSTQVNMPEMCLPVRVYLRAVCKSYIMVSVDREWDKEKCGMVCTHGILFCHEEGWSYENGSNWRRYYTSGGGLRNTNMFSLILWCLDSTDT